MVVVGPAVVVVVGAAVVGGGGVVGGAKVVVVTHAPQVITATSPLPEGKVDQGCPEELAGHAD